MSKKINIVLGNKKYRIDGEAKGQENCRPEGYLFDEVAFAALNSKSELYDTFKKILEITLNESEYEYYTKRFEVKDDNVDNIEEVKKMLKSIAENQSIYYGNRNKECLDKIRDIIIGKEEGYTIGNIILMGYANLGETLELLNKYKINYKVFTHPSRQAQNRMISNKLDGITDVFNKCFEKNHDY
ncbi:hypothetical protein [Liquorilactobacillus hordei]|uniref:Uncharacterized protein n=1 Tax=Liquorilactobacillus hordei DSM 19519 TaxID=1423759 RepID=A0A0R1MPE2_9LACO|nr:hypothetical protein [Liquorilactobacillus hordei]KRL06419.1 hypothetical protein FC92_GL000773 [Liquorilactobacillus hordei DSM 19519]QYH51308.1 hypothetical protein G6O70_01870 [Liquorilactobacillus hordei DSM 19519]